MPDYTPLLQVMKQSAKEAGNAERPVHVCVGKVAGVNPLRIRLDQKITLGKAQLVLTRNVTDYETEITVDGWENKRRTTIHNALNAGEEVVLLRQQGGQKYIVLDRVEEA